MLPRENTGTLYRTMLGGGIGFVLGTVAIFSFGILGLSAPIIGLMIGAAVGAWFSQREAIAFLLGYLGTGIGIFIVAQLVLNGLLGTIEETTVSQGIPFTAGMIANGSALIGGVIVAALAGQFAPSQERSPSGRAVFIAVPAVLLGLTILAFSFMTAEEWIRFEQGRAANRALLIAEEKAKAAQEAEYGLPVQSGPYLYPNRLSIAGDSFHVTMPTNDAPEAVAQYYVGTLNAQLRAGQDATSTPFWEGDFFYLGKPLHIRIARQNNVTAIDLTGPRPIRRR